MNRQNVLFFDFMYLLSISLMYWTSFSGKLLNFYNGLPLMNSVKEGHNVTGEWSDL